MKRVKNLFERLCSFDNLLAAARRAQRGKRFMRQTLAFNHRVEDEVLRLRDELLSQAYVPGPFRSFSICDPKPRMISAAPYRDRVVHHALCNVIEPVFEPSFIHASFACRVGKGTHAAADLVSRYMQGSDYALKCDISRYFPSIDHDVLKRLIRRKVGCADTLWLVEAIIDHGASAVQQADGASNALCGLPIGNQTSQFFGNVYLNPMDHFIKEELGFRRYVRYVDDFILLGDDKATLWQARDAIACYLREKLRLDLHPRKQEVGPVSSGVNFLGFRVFPERRLLIRRSGYRFARRLRGMAAAFSSGEVGMKEVRQRIAAWLGHAAHADTYGLRAALLGSVAFSRDGAREPRGSRRFLEQQ